MFHLSSTWPTAACASTSRTKLVLYARFGVPEYWIVDLPNKRLLIHCQPGPDGYHETSTFVPGTRLALTALPDIVLDLDALFP